MAHLAQLHQAAKESHRVAGLTADTLHRFFSYALEQFVLYHLLGLLRQSTPDQIRLCTRTTSKLSH
eukprot:scaffold689_cov375-Prasinococcus_capsulatus_cf.AAC.26